MCLLFAQQWSDSALTVIRHWWNRYLEPGKCEGFAQGVLHFVDFTKQAAAPNCCVEFRWKCWCLSYSFHVWPADPFRNLLREGEANNHRDRWKEERCSVTCTVRSFSPHHLVHEQWGTDVNSWSVQLGWPQVLRWNRWSRRHLLTLSLSYSRLTGSLCLRSSIWIRFFPSTRAVVLW